MAERGCIRGCKAEGVHYATCAEEGCSGCAEVKAREGVLVCDRCYGRLRRRLEAAPDIIAHLRSIADPMKAQVYDRVRVSGSGAGGAPAPVSADLLDATADIMHVVGGGRLEPGASSFRAYRQALGAVGDVLRDFDGIANDADAFAEWWQLVMSASLDEHPEFWTITRAMYRWPLEDRRTWASQPCPECGHRAVKITPPRHRHARTWFACESCGWRKTEMDDEGLWAAAFGQYAAPDDEGSTMTQKQEQEQQETKLRYMPRDIDVTEPILAGIGNVMTNAETVEAIGDYGVPTVAVAGALPVLAEQFAHLADDLAKHVRDNYANGDLMAGGARMVAAAIRESVAEGSILERIVQQLAAPEPDAAVESAEAA